MMGRFVTALVVVVPTVAKAVAKADIIRCTFTEPFVTTVYSTTESTLATRYETEGREDLSRMSRFNHECRAL